MTAIAFNAWTNDRRLGFERLSVSDVPKPYQAFRLCEVKKDGLGWKG